MSQPRRATPLGPTDRSTLRRLPQRGSHEREVVYRILDEGLVCHVGFCVDGQPFVIPTAFARDGDRLILHGSVASRLMTRLAQGAPVCVTVTLVDGLVLARSAFHSSMNYRSVVVFGEARPIEDAAEKRRALDALVEHLAPGRGAEVRPSTRQELAATTVVEVPLNEASAKVRSGPPSEPESDAALPIWAGVLPMSRVWGAPQPAPDGAQRLAVPPSVTGYDRPRG